MTHDIEDNLHVPLRNVSRKGDMDPKSTSPREKMLHKRDGPFLRAMIRASMGIKVKPISPPTLPADPSISELRKGDVINVQEGQCGS